MVKKIKLTDKEYILELEKALIFLCECYVGAEDAVSCREGDDENSKKYQDLWFNFPMIQGISNKIAVIKISQLKTNLGNRQTHKMSMFDIFERMHIGRKTTDERIIEVREAIKSSKVKF